MPGVTRYNDSLEKAHLSTAIHAMVLTAKPLERAMPEPCLLCRWVRQPGVLIMLGALLLALLWLAASGMAPWLWLVFLLYLGLVVIAGLVALAFLARRIFVKLCWKLGADSKGMGSRGHPPGGSVYVDRRAHV